MLDSGWLKKSLSIRFLDQKNYARKSLVKLKVTCLRVLKQILKCLDVEKEEKLKLRLRVDPQELGYSSQ